MCPEDVKFVIISNFPTDPIDNESYSGSPEEDLPLLLADRYLASEPRSIHTNLRSFLDLVFPDLAGHWETQLTRVWLTNSVHCTFSENVKMAERRKCARANLFRHLEPFCNPVVVLAGPSRKKYHVIYHRPFLPLGNQVSLFFKSFSQRQIIC